jgi:hypothetical protein
MTFFTLLSVDLKNTLALKDLNFRSYPKCSSISKGLLIYGNKKTQWASAGMPVEFNCVTTIVNIKLQILPYKIRYGLIQKAKL